ncbi:sulfite exporter TauE/SafE family protein [Parendozoicomonas sp. Alg238-R29]|uniref:sulfite exporter TauE/SafE family protein n=1 Tax=Parendozoicomonas sp. Alg238-R29 TaxID=2993446 RepID=UPI00248D7BF0|nr:sulfite exporter TauE/SafE family protein [Parendozoicomonas sp. Alg238-R29]
MIPADTLFYLVAIPAVLISGMAKGGLGNMLGTACVPLMALVIPPVQAAAIILPLLLVMDCLSLWKFRGQVHIEALKTILPACFFGVAIAALVFSHPSEQHVRLLIGAISLLFCFFQWLKRNNPDKQPASYRWGSFWGVLGGFTSFGIHAGGPPVTIYLLPLRLSSHLFMGTQAWIFASMNIEKIIAYGATGELNSENLIASATLLPFTPIGVLMGYGLLNHLPEKVIYGFSYLCLTVLGSILFLQGIGLLPSL